MLGTAVLQHMSTVVPLLSWRASHVKSFKQLLTFSLQAKGSSSASLHAWRGAHGGAALTFFGWAMLHGSQWQVLLANGVAYLEAEVQLAQGEQSSLHLNFMFYWDGV